MSTREGMAALPRECRAEPKLAFDGGADGLDVVSRILDEAGAASDAGGRAVVRDRPRPRAFEAAYPQLPLLWLDTEDSEGEVFWIGAADLGDAAIHLNRPIGRKYRACPAFPSPRRS